jgi:hypothetical protein
MSVEPVAERCEHCEACDAGGDLRVIIPRTAHPGVPPTTPRAGTIGPGWHEDRSVMFTRPRSVRLRSLHSGSLHITSLAFPELPG